MRPRMLMEEKHPENIRVKLFNGEWWDISGAVLDGDSIAGWVRDMASETPATFARTALRDVQRLETPRMNGAALAATVVLLPVIFFGAFLIGDRSGY